MIQIIGQIFGSSGYAIHTRSLSNALSKITNVKLSIDIPPGMEKQLTDKELELVKKKGDPDINLIITSPIYWKNYFGERNWVYLIWEGDKIPRHYLDLCIDENIEYIFVASNHTYQAVLNSLHHSQNFGGMIPNGLNLGLNDAIIPKLKIIPHGVNLNLFYPKEVKRDRFTFLCNKGFRNLEDRGGIQYAIKAFLNEFNQSDNVQLVIKLNTVYGIPDMNKIIDELKPTNKTDFAPISLIGDMDYDKLVDLYNSCDVFLSPTRAEAFNIPCIEAMACQKPVLTTNFGGQTDYVNNENGWLIGGELTEIQHELAYEGINWLTPNLDELSKQMRYCYEHLSEVQEKGKKALETAKQFTWDKTAILIKDLI